MGNIYRTEILRITYDERKNSFSVFNNKLNVFAIDKDLRSAIELFLEKVNFVVEIYSNEKKLSTGASKWLEQLIEFNKILKGEKQHENKAS